MVMNTNATIEQSYKKMLLLPQEKLSIVLTIIDQFYEEPKRKASKVKLGIADGRYHIPEDINEYDEEIASMFEESL